jgi:hypothetical protein
MNKKRLLWLFVGLVTVNLALSSVTSAQERWREERREEYREKGREQREARGHLMGRWYKDGAPCEIVYTRDGLEARNENGGTSRLVYDRDGRVRALDWEGGLRGNIRGNRIIWANGSSWSR